MSNDGNNVPVVHMENIVKRFGSVRALEGVDFTVQEREVVGLLGDNGAGKSTLIKVLTGVHRPDSGRIYFQGKPVEIKSPRHARKLGIETVYQDLALVNLMSVTRNFYLGRELIKKFGPLHFLDLKQMAVRTQEALVDIGIEIFSGARSVTEKVDKLSGGERQSVAIGRAVHFGASLLILDEPTSALSVGETEKVLKYTLNAKERGLSVIFISHNIHNVYQVADRYTILRQGRTVSNYQRGELSEGDIADIITGKREK